jgi:hypothetical protein
MSTTSKAARVFGRRVRISAERSDGKRVFDRTYAWEALDNTRRPEIVVSSLSAID